MPASKTYLFPTADALDPVNSVSIVKLSFYFFAILSAGPGTGMHIGRVPLLGHAELSVPWEG